MASNYDMDASTNCKDNFMNIRFKHFMIVFIMRISRRPLK